jgi:hypothetical protein
VKVARSAPHPNLLSVRNIFLEAFKKNYFTGYSWALEKST